MIKEKISNRIAEFVLLFQFVVTKIHSSFKLNKIFQNIILLKALKQLLLFLYFALFQK